MKDWEHEIMEELGHNKIEVNHFNQEVSDCLENMSKSMNEKYVLTQDHK